MIQVLVAVSDAISEIGLQTVLDEAEDIHATCYDPDGGDLASAVPNTVPMYSYWTSRTAVPMRA